MKKLKLFPKTFIYTLSLMLIIVLISHGLIYILLPQVYNYQQKTALEGDAATLAQQITQMRSEDRLALVTDFAAKWKADIAVQYDGYSYQMNLLGAYVDESQNLQTDKDNATVFSERNDSGIKISLAENPQGGAAYFKIKKGFSDRNGIITAIVSRQQIENAVNVILMILPFTAAICTVISILFALFYSRMLTRPIKQISSATAQMQKLQPDVRCVTNKQDEIGLLADNVNELYQSLLNTIKELEQEIHKVEETEVQKTNFLRAASHELKTPVTAVNAMLENMLMNVGKYKDRDTYLTKCKELTGQLADMIKEILDASKLDMDIQPEIEEVDIAELIQSAIDPYQMIAKSKGICFDMDLSNSFTIRVPTKMFKKVISNILSNAVSYTPKDGTVFIYLEERRLFIENEGAIIPPEHLAHIFEPFYRPEYGRDRNSGGNGLGLYIVAHILQSLNIKYEFTPAENIKGMSFRITF